MEMSYLNEIKEIAISDIDLDSIHQICSSNPDYYRHMNEDLSKDKLENLLTALPPGADLKNKRNIGFTLDKELMGYLEMVESYPDNETVLIGFFVLDASLQGKGIGSLIINNIANKLLEKGFKSIILSCASTNVASLGFWTKNGFFKAEDNEVYDDIELVIMEKSLEKQIKKT